MADEANTEQTTSPQPDPQEQPTQASGEAPKPQEGKTYTEAELNAMITARTSKLEKSLKKQFDEEAQKQAERAKLDEAERLKAEKADIEKRATEAEARAIAAERRASLAGKVADPVAALKLVDDEQHLDDDGNVNVEALLKTYPFLAPTPQGPTPTSGAGGTTPKGLNADKLKSMDSKEFAELQKRVASGERVTF